MTPEGWQKRRIREFSERLKRINIEGLDLEPLSITKDRGVILQSEKYSKRIATDPRKYVFAEDGDFAFDPMSLYYGAIGRVGGIGRGLVSPDYVVFNADQSVDSDFLLTLLRYPEMHKLYESLSETGNTFGKRRRLYWSIFVDIELTLPPLSEQKKIAAILSSVDEAIKSTEAVIDQLQVVKTAMMYEVLARGLPGRHTRFKQTEIGEVPSEWEVVSLDSCIEDGRPVCYGILMPGKGHPGGVPVVKVKDIKNNRIDESNLLLTTPELDHQYRRSRLKEGDVLLTIRGTTGRLARVPAALGNANITQDTARLSIRPSLNRDYIFYCLQGPVSQRQIQDHTRGQAVKGINIGDVRQLLVPIPSSEEQAAIASMFESIAEVEQRNTDELQALRAAKAGLMTALLTGEVRVKSDEKAA